MQMLTTVVLAAVAWLSLAASPVTAHSSCDACSCDCEPCYVPRSWRTEEPARTVATPDDAYHEIFGDGPSRSSGRKGRSSRGRKQPKKAAVKASEAPKAPAPSTPPESELPGK